MRSQAPKVRRRSLSSCPLLLYGITHFFAVNGKKRICLRLITLLPDHERVNDPSAPFQKPRSVFPKTNGELESDFTHPTQPLSALSKHRRSAPKGVEK